MPVAGEFPPEVSDGLRVAVDLPMTNPATCSFGKQTCEVPVDILAPEGAADLPTIVLVPGGPVPFAERRYLEDLAAAVARRGAVVFLTTYRSAYTGNEGESMLHDVRCAVRFARSVTADYGGDPRRVVLVGKSTGSSLALQVSVEPEVPTPDCLADGAAVPEVVVGLAGFGVSLAEAASSGPPIMLASGSDDPEKHLGPVTAERLSEAGFSAEYREIEGIDHAEMHDPVANPEVVDIIFDAVQWTDS